MPNQAKENDFDGMTVNERLRHAGLLEEFDKALADKDKEKIASILTKVSLSKENISALLETIL